MVINYLLTGMILQVWVTPEICTSKTYEIIQHWKGIIQGSSARMWAPEPNVLLWYEIPDYKPYILGIYG